MTNVNQMLKSWTRTHGNPPYWVVEKDYALSYLLASIMKVNELGERLLLKGGAALKKAYFADYRFSEDLDFSIAPDKKLNDADALMRKAASECEQLLQEQGAFLATWERMELRRPHPGDQDAYIIRVQFPGQRQPFCRLKVEITHDELILWPSVERTLLHGFPDSLSVNLRCYPPEEIVAEKLRALLQSHQRLSERGWGASRVCRDYYDLWNVLDERGIDQSQFVEKLTRKCAHRGVAFESVSDFFDPSLLDAAKQEWDRQLVPFVSDCPTAESVLGALKPMIRDLWG